MKLTNWKSVKGMLPNLLVLESKGRELGFIHKPNDTKTDKNAWRCHIGVGETTKLIGHEYDKAEAKRKVHAACLAACLIRMA